MAPRVLVAGVTTGRGRGTEEAAKAAADEIRAARIKLVRTVVVVGEPRYLQQLVHNVSNDNEADAVVIVGGAGLGPRDVTCDSLESFFERRIEGFGEAFRRLLRDELKVGVSALLARASAGVYSQCVIYVLPNQVAFVRKAIQALIVPTLAEGIDLASGAGDRALRAAPSPASG